MKRFLAAVQSDGNLEFIASAVPPKGTLVKLILHKSGQ
jgi:hypothetical protein